MKQNTKKKPPTPTQLRVILDHAQHALETHNLNLAEAWIEEYVTTIAQTMVDKENTRAIYHALQRRDSDLLSAAIASEKERLYALRVGELRKSILKKAKQ